MERNISEVINNWSYVQEEYDNKNTELIQLWYQEDWCQFVFLHYNCHAEQLRKGSIILLKEFVCINISEIICNINLETQELANIYPKRSDKISNIGNHYLGHSLDTIDPMPYKLSLSDNHSTTYFNLEYDISDCLIFHWITHTWYLKAYKHRFCLLWQLSDIWFCNGIIQLA